MDMQEAKQWIKRARKQFEPETRFNVPTAPTMLYGVGQHLLDCSVERAAQWSPTLLDARQNVPALLASIDPLQYMADSLLYNNSLLWVSCGPTLLANIGCARRYISTNLTWSNACHIIWNVWPGLDATYSMKHIQYSRNSARENHRVFRSLRECPWQIGPVDVYQSNSTFLSIIIVMARAFLSKRGLFLRFLKTLHQVLRVFC